MYITHIHLRPDVTDCSDLAYSAQEVFVHFTGKSLDDIGGEMEGRYEKEDTVSKKLCVGIIQLDTNTGTHLPVNPQLWWVKYLLPQN